MTDRDDVSRAERALVERVVGVGDPLTVGTFRYRFDSKRWEWSDEVARMHGYPPGTEPTTEMLLSHKHPDDRDRVKVMITSVEDGGTFSSHHRIVDTNGRVVEVLVVSEPMVDAEGAVIGTEGYYVDVSDTAAEYRREALDQTLPGLLDARVLIEQAKGALMLVYGVTGEQAFRVLRWRSQETNVKLRTIAERVVAELPKLAGDQVQLRTRFDHVLLTAHRDTDPVG
ncbi:PAS and ANTAR domain-containing protein [Nocardia mangyaensis]|uniref:PAS and ANTAR domain-containing protein n=1 Tax=Nocardia mangyaensis TaxID=2213200 RepID=UPI00267587DC|nr:PAS and ANTAR domain-containing protein [Nocardia mangyaensis]MDO3647010.1 PAS and ANTAR domain-containing protein [Nocardia mangyaensis]